MTSQPLSRTTKKRNYDVLEKDIDEITTDSDGLSGQEGKTASELNAIIADYHHKVKDSRMQAIIRRREENAKYIQIEAAHASVVSAHNPATYCFPPNILSAGSNGRVSNPPYHS
jgi:hypothetical protein